MLPLFLTCFQLEMFEKLEIPFTMIWICFFHVQQWLIIGDTIGSIGAKKNRVFLNGFYQREPTIIGDDYAGT